MASAKCDTPVMLPGNRITGHLTAFFILLTTESSCLWSAIVEPPTRIDDTPARCEAEATAAASDRVKSSGSTRAAHKVPLRLTLSSNQDSIRPGRNLGACLREVIHKRVVDVYLCAPNRVP